MTDAARAAVDRMWAALACAKHLRGAYPKEPDALAVTYADDCDECAWIAGRAFVGEVTIGAERIVPRMGFEAALRAMIGEGP